MKHYIYGLLALTTLLFACKPKDNVINYDKSSLVGKWEIITQNNQTVLTDNRIVYTFNADGTGTQTLSADPENVGEQNWYMQQRLKYTLNGDALHTQWVNSSAVLEWLASIISLTDNEMEVEASRVLLQTQPLSDMPVTKWKRISVDYTDDIIGLWEGVACTGITYGDHNHRWLYTPSGQYFYYSKDATGKWVISENSLNEYDIDGGYLACRWKENADAKEDREFWDISIQNKDMYWSALRQNADTKQLFTATFDMKRLSPTQKEVEEKLPGKWVAYMINDELIPTNEKSVHEFDGNGIVVYTVPDLKKKISKWTMPQLNYSINGSYLVERGLDNGTLVQWRSNLTSISDSDLLVYAFSSTRDVSESGLPYNEIRLEKVNANYRKMIQCGKDSIWQGIAGEGKYGDFNHLWEYQDSVKGVYHYIYYAKNENNEWYKYNDEVSEYLVEGNWLATGWTNSGVYNSEMWDIEIQNDTMRWSGVRDDGINRFTMVKVPRSSVGPFKD